MQRKILGVWVCALVFLFSFAALTNAETGAVPRHITPQNYNLSREITVSGLVTSVLSRPNRGMLWGPHLLFRTSSGNMDASLGHFALIGKGALSVKAGQQVEVTGLMKSFHGQPVLLARIVKVGSQSYILRSTQGASLHPSARQGALNGSPKGAQQ